MVAPAMVLAPAPLVTVTIERKGDDPDIHVHAGGQGFWLARMVRALELPVTLCGSFGGETGLVARTLIEHEDLTVTGIATEGSNGGYVHDRRSGEREVIAEMPSPALSRHEVDELYGLALVEGLDASVCVLGGPHGTGVVPADMYRRLASDLTNNGKMVVADLSGEPLEAVLLGGVSVLKVSHEELLGDGWAESDDDEALIAALAKLLEAGAHTVIITRAEKPALAAVDEQVWEIIVPRLEPHDPRGAGDSLTAGVAAGLARGLPMDDAVRLGAAAGALNVTRRGLATGERSEIERLAEHVELRSWSASSPSGGGQTRDRSVTTSPDQLAARVRADR